MEDFLCWLDCLGQAHSVKPPPSHPTFVSPGIALFACKKAQSPYKEACDWFQHTMCQAQHSGMEGNQGERQCLWSTVACYHQVGCIGMGSGVKGMDCPICLFPLVSWNGRRPCEGGFPAGLHGTTPEVYWLQSLQLKSSTSQGYNDLTRLFTCCPQPHWEIHASSVSPAY